MLVFRSIIKWNYLKPMEVIFKEVVIFSIYSRSGFGLERQALCARLVSSLKTLQEVPAKKLGF